nr:putative ribonuclease H-like domain-containing protein [Tanacetum cinerariifolium]
MNKLVRHNLVRGLPTKCFENNHTCTACLKGKQHKASCKSKLVNSVSKPLHTLHMDLFGPISDETSSILRKFITEIENLKDLKVKIISTDVPESSGNCNPTATSTNSSADQLETLTVETPIPTFEDILGVTTNSVDSDGMEAAVSNMETTITASPTPTLRIHKDHPESQII